MCFPVSFAKYFRASFLQNTSEWLLLQNILLLSRQPQLENVTIDLVFSFFLNIFRANASLFWKY